MYIYLGIVIYNDNNSFMVYIFGEKIYKPLNKQCLNSYCFEWAQKCILHYKYNKHFIFYRQSDLNLYDRFLIHIPINNLIAENLFFYFETTKTNILQSKST